MSDKIVKISFKDIPDKCNGKISNVFLLDECEGINKEEYIYFNDEWNTDSTIK